MLPGTSEEDPISPAPIPRFLSRTRAAVLWLTLTPNSVRRLSLNTCLVRDLLEVIEDRTGRKATLVTSQLPFERFLGMTPPGGLAGLLPKRPGPKGAHKLTDEVMAFIDEVLEGDHGLGSEELSRSVSERFGLSVHPRSIERALARREKKRRRPM
jgi:hypothetical protein